MPITSSSVSARMQGTSFRPEFEGGVFAAVSRDDHVSAVNLFDPDMCADAVGRDAFYEQGVGLGVTTGRTALYHAFSCKCSGFTFPMFFIFLPLLWGGLSMRALGSPAVPALTPLSGPGEAAG
jgi:hypothetical protein